MPGRGGEEGASVLQSALIGMNAHSKEKELAWELIRQILSEDMQKDLIDHSYGIPVLKTIFEDPEAELLQAGDALNVGTILDVVEKAISEPLFDSYLEAMDVADREISAVINTDVDISRVKSGGSSSEEPPPRPLTKKRQRSFLQKGEKTKRKRGMECRNK